MKTFAYIMLFLAVSVPSFAYTIDGMVYGQEKNGKKSPLPFATVQWLESKKGTYSDKNGKYSLEKTAKDKHLIVRSVTFLIDTVAVLNQKNIDITLISDFKIEKVKVTANQPGMMIDASSIERSETITMQGLRKAACCNLAESFQTNASVDVEFADAVSGAKQIKLLGLDGIYTQLMFEKIPTLRGIASVFGLNYIPGSWMESIQISKGAASVSTGYESITGQINVEYKKPNKGEPLHINLFGNQYARLEGDVNASYELNDELSTMIFLHGNTMQNEVDKNGDGFLDVPKSDQINLMNRWNYVTEDVHIQFGVKGLYEDRRGGQKGFFDTDNSDLYGLKILTERYGAFLKTGLILDAEKYESIAMILSASKHKQDAIIGRNKYFANQNSLYANLIYQFKLSSDIGEEKELGHDISVGASFQFDEYDETYRMIDQFRTESVPGVFAEYTIYEFYDFTVVAGLRADFHNKYGTFIIPRSHLKYQFADETSFRLSAGKGMRTPNIYAENIGLMVSSREFIVQDDLKPEEAWNYGVNFQTTFELFDTDFTVNTDYFRTEFSEQVIVDIDRSPGKAYFYNLDGQSYSNSFQIDVIFEPFSGLELTTAYRLNDVQMTINDKLQKKPLISPHKWFFNGLYTTDDDMWSFDLTVEYRGGGRLPNMNSNPEHLRLADNFDGFIMAHAQITLKISDFEIYLGAENLTNYTQKNPILDAANPFGKHFDSSIIWAPVHGRTFYTGVRFDL